jgi:hypothetical protein
MRILFQFFGLAALLVFMAAPAKAGAIIEGDCSDAMLTQTLINSGYYDTNESLEVGGLYNNDNGVIVEAFLLPYLAPGQQISGATISFYLQQLNNPPVTCNGQLYGLNRVSTSSSAPLLSDWYVGSNDTANTLLTPTFVTAQSTVNQACTYSGSNLVSFIQKQYGNSAFSGLDLSSSRFIFFRLSPNTTQSSFNNFQFASARHPNRAFHPTLTLTISNGITNVAGRLQFSFSLPQSSVTSAGVYNTSTGALIRTLWNNVQYAQGVNYGGWDGKDDNGNAVATGSNYQIKLIYHNVQYIWNGTVGNSSTAQSGLQVYHSYVPMFDMAIAGGNAYYSVGYNELENVLHTFAVGNPQAPSQIQPGFSDPFSNIGYIAADATRCYWSKVPGGMNPSDTWIVATNNSDGSFYTFPKGTANPSNKYPSCIDFDSTANQANPAGGLAVQQSGSMLFVSHPSLNLVRVFDKVQGNLLGSFSVTNPGRLATTANGDVWVTSNTTPPVIKRYTYANGSATLKVTITGVSGPIGLGVSPDDSLLVVADGGSSQQIKAFNNTTGTSAWTYGSLGGMAANGPSINSDTFAFSSYFSNNSFVAFQADGSFWVGDAGNQRDVHFNISNNSLVFVEQISYSTASYQSTVDLSDPTRVFNGFLEYTVNYAQPLGGTNGSWTLVKNWAYGLPNDSGHQYTIGFTNGINNVVTLSNGRAYAFLLNFITGNYDLIELSPTGPARETGYAFNTFPRMYADGTLRFNITTSSSLSFYSQPLTGFDALNNPKWGSPALVATTAIGTNDPQTWNTYPERSEETATGKMIEFDPCQGRLGFHIGAIPTGGTSWLWRSSPSLPSTYTGFFPQDGHFDCGNGVQYAGNEDMAAGRNIIYGYHGEFWKGGEAGQWVNYFDNGLMVGRFGTYGMDVQPQAVTDGFCGNCFAPTLVQAANGNTYLYCNDESNHGGVGRWLIQGWNSIVEISGTGALGGTASLSSTTGPVVTITSPTAGAAYLNGHSITLSAQAASSGAAITGVQFLDGTTSLGTVSYAPFTLNFAGLSSGSHVITAVARDANGASTTSTPVSITVGAEGSTTPPPAPISLANSPLGSGGVPLNWTEPTISTTSSTIGQRISYQFDETTDSKALTPSMVAGAPLYAAAYYNLLPQTSTPGLVFANPTNSLGGIVPNLGVNCQMESEDANGSTASLTGSAVNIFAAEVTTTFNTQTAVSISNIPYALYDVVVYSLPDGVSSGTQTTTVTVSDNVNTSLVTQNFTAVPIGFSVADVPFGTSTSVNNADTVVVQGVTASSFKLQGLHLAGFQIVERPYDQGTPTTFSIERSTGTSGNFAVVGSVSGTTLGFTDTTAAASTTYQYRVQAINSYGKSAYSNIITVTTPASATGSTGAPTSAGFAAWQTNYFTAAQLSDPTISGPNADPYGSGIKNLLAYALQLNPATAKPSDQPHSVLSNGHLTLTYFAPSSITDITYIVEVSSDLVNWNSGQGYTQVTSTVSSAGGNTVTVQDLVTTSSVKHFMRLRVTQNQ